MDRVVLKSETSSGQALEAVFLPEQGMKLVSLKRGDRELMGVGGDIRVIGPHFADRHRGTLPVLKDPSAWTHIAEGHHDPFHHGVARYAPWKVEASKDALRAQISGKDTWNETLLKDLEGQAFTMQLNAKLSPEGLSLYVAVVGDADSLVGLDYRFAVKNGNGRVHGDVGDEYIDKSGSKPLPPEWLNGQGRLNWPLDKPIDAIFHSFREPLHRSIHLETADYKLQLDYSCKNAENSWQLKREGAFVHLTPLAAKSPYRPVLTVNSLTANLSIVMD